MCGSLDLQSVACLLWEFSATAWASHMPNMSGADDPAIETLSQQVEQTQKFCSYT